MLYIQHPKEEKIMADTRRETFGGFFKRKRREMRLSLRAFCRDNGFDAGNISKLERGLLPPPQNEETRTRYFEALGIQKGSDDWLKMCDLAAVESRTVPDDIARDEEMLRHLPVLFRTIRDSKLTAGEIKRLIEIVRKESK